MAPKDSKKQGWKFWKQWVAVERKRDEETQVPASDSSTHSADPAEDEGLTRDQHGQELALNHINTPTSSTAIDEIDRLKLELDALRPLPFDVVGQIEQKLRIESNYHSNAIEGNSLTLGETRSLILHGLTAHGKTMRDHLDIEGHDEAVKAIEDAVKRNESLNEVFIRNLHRILLKEPYEIDAITPDGQPTRRLITIGQYKTQPNNVETSTGEIYYYTPPDQVKPEMTDLIDWYRKTENVGEHPIVIAATFHYRFVRIHPFDDGNGRIARLLMNLILIKHGYTVAIIPIQERNRYIESLEQADKSEDLAEFIAYVAGCCEYTLGLHLKAARGENIEEADDIDKEIALFKQSIDRGTGELIRAREYARTVLHPFFYYCKDKCEQFTEMVESADVYSGECSLRNVDGKVSSLDMPEDKVAAWPEYAAFATTSIGISFNQFQAKQDADFYFRIENEIGSNGSIWRFSSTDFNYEKEYAGQNLEVLKRIFNEMIRQLMTRLSEISDNQDG